MATAIDIANTSNIAVSPFRCVIVCTSPAFGSTQRPGLYPVSVALPINGSHAKFILAILIIFIVKQPRMDLDPPSAVKFG